MLQAIGLLRAGDEENGEYWERLDVLMKAGDLYSVPVYSYLVSDVPKYLELGRIPAMYWSDGEYHNTEIDFPKYTETFSSVGFFKKNYPDEFSWILENTVFTDEFGLSKIVLQSLLSRDPQLSQYSIPTFPIRCYEDVISSAKLLPVSFLKPVSARKAKGAMKLENHSGKLYYSTPEGNGEFNEIAFREYYGSYGYNENALLILEPCLNILNEDGRAVDFRCLVSLNGVGEWQNVMTYARIGGSGVASNFSHGGSLNFAEDVLDELLPGKGKQKLVEINRVALEVARFVQKNSKKTSSFLGLDICVDRPSENVYVIEANSKPGTKLVSPWPLCLVRAQYFKYLLSQPE